MAFTIENQTDNELLARYALSGDEGAFSRLVERHLLLVMECAMRRIGCRESSEDVAFHVFTILSRKAAQLEGHPALSAWLRQAAIFESAKAVRRDAIYRKKLVAFEDRVRSQGTGESVWTEASQWLDSALLGLAEADSQVLHWHYVEGRSYREIGALLGISEGACRVRSKRALTRLASWFRNKGFPLSLPALDRGLGRAAPMNSGVMETSNLRNKMNETSSHSPEPPSELKGVHAATIKRMIAEAQPFRTGATPEELVAEFAHGTKRMPAFLALCGLGSAALPAIRKGFTDANWHVRHWCAVVADNFADPETLQALVPLLEDPKSQVRVWAVHALTCDLCKGESRVFDAVPLLLTRIAEDESIKVRRQAVAMLAHHHELDDRVVPVFERIMNNEDDPKMRFHAGKGLVRYADAGMLE